MQCPGCAAPVADGVRFCSNCGQSLLNLTEERRVVTVVFADLVGFTTLSEHRDPEAVKRVVDSAFERLVRDVNAFGGRVDKIVGDAIIALFGAPVAHEDDAERAVRAALRMQETLAGYGREAGIDIRMRVGVNTGEVLVGALRAGGDYTAMGDVVNLASRLQTAATPGEVVVGDSTQRSTAGAIDYESRGQLTARGREQSERVWAAVGTLRPPGRRPRRTQTPLVGRDREMTLLLSAARGSIHHSRAQVILLVGEAGVGKSRLAEELGRYLEEEDAASCFAGRCLPYGEVNPWWPIAEALRSGCGVGPDTPLEEALSSTRASVESVLGDDGSETDAVVDGLLHIMGHDTPLRSLDGTAARAEATQALLSFLEGGLRQGPILVRLSDLHWADDAVFELIDELSSRLARQPLVFVGTARRSLQGRWTPRPGRFNSLMLNVDALDHRAVDTLVDHLARDVIDGGGLAENTRTLLLDRSGGNPLYLEELVTLLRREPAGAPGGATVLPDTLRGLIAARVDALSAEEQAVLSDASVWGASGPVVALDRLAEATRGVPSVAGEVQSLADKDVLVLTGTHWSFRSDLVREVTYSRLTKSDRLKSHAGIATYLDRVTADRPPEDAMVEAVSRHYSEAVSLMVDLEGEEVAAELAGRAVHWATEAARRAERSGSWPVALRLYDRALELVGDGAGAEEVDALLGRSRVNAEQWHHDDALADARTALARAEQLHWPEKRAEALLRVAAAEMRRTRWDVTDDALAEALDIYDSLGDTAGRGETLRQQGLAFLLRGDQRAAEAPIQAALEAFRAVHDRRGQGWAFQSLAWIAFGDGRAERAEQLIEASTAAFTEVGDRGGLQWTIGLAAFVQLTRGDLARARDLAQRVLVEGERRNDRFATGMMNIVLGTVELWSGHPASAVTSAASALAGLQASGEQSSIDGVGTEQALTLQGRALVMGGDLHGGVERLRRALEVGAHTSTRFAQAVALLTEVQLGLPGLLTGEDPALSSNREASDGEAAAVFGDEGVMALDLSDALWHLQRGDAGPAAAVLSVTDDEELDPGRRATLAVLAGALGQPGRAERAVGALLAEDRASYHDRWTALVVRGLLDRGPDGAASIEEARSTVEATEDVVSAVLVDLADTVRRECFGHPVGAAAEPASSDVSRALARTGLADTAWRSVFAAIADSASESAPRP